MTIFLLIRFGFLLGLASKATAFLSTGAKANGVQYARSSETSLSTLELQGAFNSVTEPLAAVGSALISLVEDSPEPIHSAFSVATFLPQPFWLLIILFPNQRITKQIMAGLEIPLLFALVHFFIVSASLFSSEDSTAPLAEFNEVFNPSGDPQQAFLKMTSRYPNFVAEEWSHVLTWDLFVGRYVWIDGLRRGIFTPHSILFCNLIGPPGLLLHWLTCALSGKPILDPDEKQSIIDQ